jgi:hypothetical protein
MMTAARFLEESLSIFKLPGIGEGPRNDTIPENILAFRTITTILSQLPRSAPIEAINNLDGQIKDSGDRRETRISDAFAHLAVGEHDVAALTTNRITSPSGTRLHVMTCTHNLPDGENGTRPGNPDARKNSWYLMARNFLQDGVESRNPHPTITSPSQPADLGGRDAFTYMVDLELSW